MQSFNLRIEILIIDRLSVHRVRFQQSAVSISELRFLSLIGRPKRRIWAEKQVSISELRFLSLIVLDPDIGIEPIDCFNLRIEILIIDSWEPFIPIVCHINVSISELRFLSLIEPIISDQC